MSAVLLPVLTMSTPIHCITTLGNLLQKNIDLKQANEQLTQWLESLAADITAQGSVVVGKHTFTS